MMIKSACFSISFKLITAKTIIIDNLKKIIEALITKQTDLTFTTFLQNQVLMRTTTSSNKKKNSSL